MRQLENAKTRLIPPLSISLIFTRFSPYGMKIVSPKSRPDNHRDGFLVDVLKRVIFFKQCFFLRNFIHLP